MLAATQQILVFLDAAAIDLRMQLFQAAVLDSLRPRPASIGAGSGAVCSASASGSFRHE